MLKTKTTLKDFIKDLTSNTKKHSLNLLLVAIISSVFVFVILAIFFGLYYLIISKTTISTILAVRFTFIVLNYLLVLVLASIVQIVTLKALFQPQIKISSMIADVKTYFWRFLGLSIIINILFFLFTLPIYAGIFLFAVQNIIMSLIAFLVGILLLLLFVSYIMFSPFIMIEKQKNIYQSIKASMDLASADIWGIVVKIICLIIVMILLNLLISIFIVIPIIGPIIEIAAIFVFFIIFLIYIYTIYQNLKGNA